LIERPGDREVGVVPDDGAFTWRIVAASGLVEDLGGFGEDEEAMCEALGDPEQFELAVAVARLEVEGRPATEVGRVATEINGDVPDVSGEDAYEFSLGVTKLVMETPEYTARGERLIVLSEDRGKAERSEGIRVEDLREPTALVAESFGLQDLYIAQGGIT
jgi:hypothetical protein